MRRACHHYAGPVARRSALCKRIAPDRCDILNRLIENGVVKILNLEKSGQFEVSAVEKMLEKL
jgi:peroxiredoxin